MLTIEKEMSAYYTKKIELIEEDYTTNFLE
jgi:hypothetical protein